MEFDSQRDWISCISFTKWTLGTRLVWIGGINTLIIQGNFQCNSILNAQPCQDNVLTRAISFNHLNNVLSNLWPCFLMNCNNHLLAIPHLSLFCADPLVFQVVFQHTKSWSLETSRTFSPNSQSFVGHTYFQILA